jgi:nitrogen-specific signal transduction histidine kinase
MIHRQPVDVAAVAQSVAELLSVKTGAVRVVIRFDLARSLPPAFGHSLSLRQAPLELVRAAIITPRRSRTWRRMRSSSRRGRTPGGRAHVNDAAGSIAEALLGPVFAPRP